SGVVAATYTVKGADVDERAHRVVAVLLSWATEHDTILRNLQVRSASLEEVFLQVADGTAAPVGGWAPRNTCSASQTFRGENTMSTTTVVSTGRRPSVSPLKQILRLTRTEFTLFVRYKTAWMFLFLPLLFAFLALQMPNDEVLPGFGMAEMVMLSMMGAISLVLGLGHVSNVFTARRESLVLKRFRVSGVPQVVIFGGIIGVVTVFSLFIAVLMGGLILMM